MSDPAHRFRRWQKLSRERIARIESRLNRWCLHRICAGKAGTAQQQQENWDAHDNMREAVLAAQRFNKTGRDNGQADI